MPSPRRTPISHRARRTVVAAITGLIGLAMTLPANAHNGVGAFYKGHVGAYTLYAYDGYPLPHNGLEYRLILLNRATGEPADGFTVNITAAQPGLPSRTAPAHTYANVVFYDLPNPYPHDWHVTVQVGGRPGRGVFSFQTHGAPPAAGDPNIIYTETQSINWPLVATGTAAAATAIGGGGMIRSRGWRCHGGSASSRPQLIVGRTGSFR